MNRTLLVAALLVGALGCNVQGADGRAVEVLDGQFSPSRLTVRVGTAVGWSWNGTQEHSVKFSDSDESPIQLDGSFDKTFDAPGTYNYSCGVHPGMGGTIYVE